MRGLARTFCLILLTAAAAAAQPVDPGRGLPEEQEAGEGAALSALTPRQWREDVEYLSDRILSIHPDPFRHVSESEFDRQTERLLSRISALEPTEIVVGMTRLLALVHDGHTTMPLGFPGFGDAAASRLGIRWLPVRFYAFEEGLTVVAAQPGHEDLVGRRVAAIGNLSADSALALAMAAAPSDNLYGALGHAARLLQSPDLLVGLGVAPDAASVELTTEGRDGQRTVRLAPVARAAPWIVVPSSPGGAGAPREAEPLYRRNPDLAYWSEYLPEERMMYVQYNAVRNAADRTIEQFFDDVFAEADRRRAERLVLDLRFNTGGNNSLNWPIIYDIIRSDRLNRRGRLFVLIGRRTFSAAQNAVNWLELHTSAVFVGEPTAAHPNHYGDALHFRLPNSGLPFQVSALYWQHHPRDARRWTAPDVHAPPTAAAYFAGSDPALEAIEGWDPTPIFDRLVERLESDGVAAAMREYEDFRRDPRNRFVDVESDLNRFGYELVRSGRLEAGVEVFRLVVEAYPGSANAHDSYAEGLWRMGRIDAAKEHYGRAIELAPEGFVGRNARSMLARIEAGQPPP